MKKIFIFLGLMLLALPSGCISRNAGGVDRASTRAAGEPLLAMSTTTPTLISGSPETPGALPEESKGYVLEFTHSVSSGLATIHAAARTCTGIRGPWEGSFNLVMNAGEMTIQGSGPFNFTLSSDRLAAAGEAPFSGSGTVSGHSCTILDVSDPLKFEIILHPETLTAELIMGSTGGGTFTAQCGDEPPVTIPFAVSWGPEPLVVPITLLAHCS